MPAYTDLGPEGIHHKIMTHQGRSVNSDYGKNLMVNFYLSIFNRKCY